MIEKKRKTKPHTLAAAGAGGWSFHHRARASTLEQAMSGLVGTIKVMKASDVVEQEAETSELGPLVRLLLLPPWVLALCFLVVLVCPGLEAAFVVFALVSPPSFPLGPIAFLSMVPPSPSTVAFLGQPGPLLDQLYYL